jgi:archaellum component FlaG (FlaF/FlaG flagellin family)
MSSLRSLTAIFIAAILLATGVAGYATYIASHATIDRLVNERVIELSASLMTGVQPGDA